MNKRPLFLIHPSSFILHPFLMLPFPADSGSTLGLYFGVPCTNLRDYTEEGGSEGVVVRLPVLGLWADRLKLVSDALGIVINNGSGTIQRQLPTHPVEPYLQDFLRCQSWRLIGGRGVITNGPAGEPAFRSNTELKAGGYAPGLAHLEFVFARPPYLVLSDSALAGVPAPKELGRYVQRQVQIDGTFVDLPGFSLKWKNAVPEETIKKSAVKLFPCREMTYTCWDWPDYPDAAIQDTLGKVNAADFDGAIFGGPTNPYPPGTVLYLGGSWEPLEIKNPYQPLPSEDRSEFCLWKITHKFQYRKEGHNFFYRASTNQFEEVVKARGSQTGQPPFESGDFNALFSLPVLPGLRAVPSIQPRRIP